MHHNGKINLSQFEGAYLKVIGTACRPAEYGYSTLVALLQAISCTVVIENIRHKRKIVKINKKLAGKYFENSFNKIDHSYIFSIFYNHLKVSLCGYF